MAGQSDQTASCDHGLQVRADRQRRLASRIGKDDHPLLDGAGGVSAKQVKALVEAGYDRWRAYTINAPDPEEQRLVDAVGNVKAWAVGTPKRGRGSAA